MYLIQFCHQFFFINIHLFIPEIATRLQAWAPKRGGGKSRPSPPPLKKKFIVGLSATFSSYEGLFATFFSFLGAFSPCGGLFATFTSWWGPFLGLPFHPTKISVGAHDCKEGSRACSREIFLCDRNLVSSGHVLLRFCLKNDKNNDKW